MLYEADVYEDEHVCSVELDPDSDADFPPPCEHSSHQGERKLLHREGSVKYEGDIWLIERPVLTLQTMTPMTQYGIWDCAQFASESLRLGRELRRRFRAASTRMSLC